jgi:tetratricopeptide (TPR) repeat protein
MSKAGPGLQRFQGAHDPREQAQAWLDASRVLAQQGDVDQARRLAKSAVRADPAFAEARFRLALLSPDPAERKALLQRVLDLDPDHAQARAELARYQVPAPSREPPPRTAIPKRTVRWVLIGLILVALVALVSIYLWGPVDPSLAWLRPTAAPTPSPTPTLTPGEIAAQFQPQLDSAISNQDWDRVLEIASIMLGVDPSGEEARASAHSAYMQHGQALVGMGKVDLALAQFDRALSLVPEDSEAGGWRQVAQLYLDGREAFQASDWSAAIQTWNQAYDQMPGFGDLSARLTEAYRRQGQTALEAGEWTLAVQALSDAHERLPTDVALDELLSTAYRQRGIAWQEEGKLQRARADLEAALALRPDDEEARTHYDAVMYILFPPKRIEIDISEQHFYAWLGDTLVYSFPTSTGIPGRDTATGHFEVLDKIPMAYSSIWRLKMPYWLGIYYVGNIENGIHALPIRPDGTVMWGGLLGRKASYGCVILSTEAARIIYDWAEIGTSVDIHY